MRVLPVSGRSRKAFAHVKDIIGGNRGYCGSRWLRGPRNPIQHVLNRLSDCSSARAIGNAAADANSRADNANNAGDACNVHRRPASFIRGRFSRHSASQRAADGRHAGTKKRCSNPSSGHSAAEQSR